MILDFWRHDCAPCLVELPKLEKLALEWGDKVSVQLIHVGGPEEAMQEKLTKYGGRLSCAFDANQCTAARYCVRSFPQLFVIDADGVVRAHIEEGQKDFAKAVRAAVEPLIQEK